MEDPGPLPQLLILLVSVVKSISYENIIAILTVLMLLVSSALVSGSEVAFFSLSPSDIDDLKQKKEEKSNAVVSLLKKPKRLLATILISNNFINVAIVMISAFITRDIFDFRQTPIVGFFVEVVVITSLLLVFGEIVPKMIASHKPISFANVMVLPMRNLIRIFYPFSSVLVKSTNIIDNKISKSNNEISIDEISDAIEEISDDYSHEKDKEILRGIVRFSDIVVREIMTNRVDITAFEKNMSLDDVIKNIVESGFSRIPVYEGGLDQIIGVLYIKDLLPHLSEKDYQWNNNLRQPFYVPENKPIRVLLQDFQDNKIHFAVVVDEYGGSQGIVTLEDVIEEIIGDISDEFDTPSHDIDYEKLSNNRYLFEGRTLINDFCKVFDIESDYFDDNKGDADTVAGMILEIVEILPEKGTKVLVKDFIFVVAEVDDRRIIKVEVNRNEQK